MLWKKAVDGDMAPESEARLLELLTLFLSSTDYKWIWNEWWVAGLRVLWLIGQGTHPIVGEARA